MEGINYNDDNPHFIENNTTLTSEQRKKTYLEALKEKNSPKIGEVHDVIIIQNKPLEITKYRSTQHEETSPEEQSPSRLNPTNRLDTNTQHTKQDKGKRRATEDSIPSRKKTQTNQDWTDQLEETENYSTHPNPTTYEDDQPDYEDPDTWIKFKRKKRFSTLISLHSVPGENN